MTKKEPGVSRRNVIASTGAIAAAGVVGVRPGFAEEDPTEVQGWHACVGETFTIGRARSLRDIPPKLVLVGVKEFTAPDPDRPPEFRPQFTLLFEPAARSRIVEAGTYVLNNPIAGRVEMFINETRDLNYSDGVLFQAVFG